MKRVTERELSYLSFSALAVVGSEGKLGYRDLRRLLQESPPEIPRFPYPLHYAADRVLRQLPDAYKSGRGGPLARYLTEWARQQRAFGEE